MRSFYDFYNRLYLEASVHPVILKDSESIIKKAIQNYFLVEKNKSDYPDFEDFVISSKNKNHELKDVDILLTFSLTEIDETFDDDEYSLDYKNHKFPNFEDPIKSNDFYHLNIQEEEEEKQSDYQKKLDDANKAPDIGNIKKTLLSNLENFKPHNHRIKIYVDFHPNATYEKVADVLTKEIINEIQKIINNLD